MAASLIYLLLPRAVQIGPDWIVPLVVGAVLVPLTLISHVRDVAEEQWLRIAAITLVGLILVVNVAVLGLVVDQLLGGPMFDRTQVSGIPLLSAGLIVWTQNVMGFSLWYWELDRGGPGRRGRSQDVGPPDFFFPQMDVGAIGPPGWQPRFVDYFYTAFTNASAFSPTDTMPLTGRAKILMLLQSFVSLIIVVLVTARAVNVLR